MFKIKKAVVIGTGVMGGGIAAHLANSGLEVLLLDILPEKLTEEDRHQGLTTDMPEWRNKLARTSLENLLNSPRPVFVSEKSYASIQVGNLEDDLNRIADYDWIIETIVEKVEIKKVLFAKIEKTRRGDSIVSTNTSGIPIEQISADFSPQLKKCFLGTHFFNPPTYAQLIELIPGKETSSELIAYMKDFLMTVLNKKPIVVKDTPNFIANRIGLAGAINVCHLAHAKGYTVEEADLICGKNMGRMSSAVFKMIDAIGLDTVYNIIRNLFEKAENDEFRQRFVFPEYALRMLEKGYLGNKTGQGFYKPDCSGKELVIDLDTLEYRERVEPAFSGLEKVNQANSPAGKIRALFVSEGKYPWLAWQVLYDDLCYAVNRVGEIADSIADIDNAMKWGYSWRLGPFECWDAIGLPESVARMRKEGKEVPPRILSMFERNNTSFYMNDNGKRLYYDFDSKSYLPVL